MTVIAILFLLSPRDLVPAYKECDRRWIDAQVRANEFSAVLDKARKNAGDNPTCKKLLSAQHWHDQAVKERDACFALTWVSWPHVNDRWEWYVKYLKSSDNAFRGRP